MEGGEIFSSIWDPRISTIDALDYFNRNNLVEGDIVTAGVGDTRINCQGVHGLVARGQAGDDTITGDSNLANTPNLSAADFVVI